MDGALALDYPSRTAALQPNEQRGYGLSPCEIHKSVSGRFFRTTFPGIREQTESRKVMVRMMSSSTDLVGELTGELHDGSFKRPALIHDVSRRNLGSKPNKLPVGRVELLTPAVVRRLLRRIPITTSEDAARIFPASGVGLSKTRFALDSHLISEA